MRQPSVVSSRDNFNDAVSDVSLYTAGSIKHNGRRTILVFNLTFSFNDEQPTSPVGFEMGDIDVHGDIATATSRSRTPRQSMMLVLSVADMLDGIRRLLSRPMERIYEFCGTDCSFRIVFSKRKNHMIDVHVDGRLLQVTTASELVAAIENSVTALMNAYDLSAMANPTELRQFNDAHLDFQQFSHGGDGFGK